MIALTQPWLPEAAAECHKLLEACHAAERTERLARQNVDLIGPNIAMFRRRSADANREHTAATTACLKRFAESRGCKPGKPTCTIDALWTAAEHRKRSFDGPIPDPPGSVIDHAVELKGGRRVVAVLSSTYAPLHAIEQYAAAHGLRHEILPASWYSKRTIAVLFRRAGQ